MLVENNKVNAFAISEAIYVPHLQQSGTVVSDEGTMIRVKLSHGGTILLEKDKVQKRRMLLG